MSALLGVYAPDVHRSLQINPKWQSVLEADDVMSVTYHEAFDRIRLFEGGIEHFPGWLATIANHNLKDAIRWISAGKRPHPDNRSGPGGEHDLLDAVFSELSSGGTRPSQAMSRSEMKAAIAEAMTCIPEDYRVVIELRYGRGLVFGAIAEHLGRSEPAVYLLHLRAKERLARVLDLGGSL